ncbi:MAG: iron-desferrioxamine transport system substrate-binding protein [Nocardioidaceae bacterium]|jgi:iron complex transport system substrate-binding protein|nr:iron-desferrioxamine transport system substrate-binding protein [Nocardioidaceae bacterium]
MKRALLAASSAIALVMLTACGSSSSSDDASGPWTYTDDRGTKISLDGTPRRIVAQSSVAAALSELGLDDQIVGTFGPLKLPDGSVDPQAAGLEPDDVTDVTGGGEYGSLDLEKLAALKPDLIVTNMYIKPDLWYLNDATAKRVEKLAPTLAINFQGLDLVETIESVEKVAARLGADLKDDDAVEAREAFDGASKRLAAVGDRLDGKTVLPVSATADLFYAGDPAQFPDIAYYRSIGLPIADVKAKKGSYWDELSWEKSDKYDSDIVLWDDRLGAAGLKTLKAQPVFSTIKGAKAGAYVPWAAVTPPGYEAYARIIDTLVNDLEENL